MNAPRRKVLIVDDVPLNIQVLHEVLEADYEVFFATDGPSALSRVKADAPDIVLLDVMMPGMDGFEVCRHLKADPATRDIPVIFVTALGDAEAETHGLDAGAIDYITKPVVPAVVRARVRNHLEVKRHRDLLARLSNVDGLTGVANRRRFDEALAEEWRRGLRAGTSLALVMVDIDHFKAYNDRYGHLAGDDCLKLVAAALRQPLGRAGDLVARLGGEEFAVLLPETERDAALQLAEQLRDAIASLRVVHGASPTAPVVTASLGVAALRPTGSDPAPLMQAADAFLYEAKRAGRNRVAGRDLDKAVAAPEPIPH